MEIDLSKIKKIFFIGIGGIGISALAQMAKSQGIEVSGLNDEETGKTLDTLREAGIPVTFLKDFPDLPAEALAKEGADMYVFSDAWIYRGPEILESARVSGKPTLSYFEALGEFAKKYKVIAISGTHGKTTTTAMVAGILEDAGLDPTVVVGSFVPTFSSGSRLEGRDKKGSNFRLGKGEYLVVEADEFNRHMLQLHPYIGAITNIEADHLDVYKDLEDIKQAFGKFVAQSQHSITEYSKYVDKVPKLSVSGEHNRMNAAVALAVADALGIPSEVAQKSLSQFTGTWRRLEKIGQTAEGVIVYDDYAHHPTEVRASLQALRELYPKGTQSSKHITVLFQPHLYSRTKALFTEFTKCFAEADNVFLLPIYFAREAPDPEVSSEKLAEAITQNGQPAKAFATFELAESSIKSMKLGENDVFVTMGAGEAYKVAEKIFQIV